MALHSFEKSTIVRAGICSKLLKEALLMDLSLRAQKACADGEVRGWAEGEDWRCSAAVPVITLPSLSALLDPLSGDVAAHESIPRISRIPGFVVVQDKTNSIKV